jgi:hypothetical protein
VTFVSEDKKPGKMRKFCKFLVHTLIPMFFNIV